MGHKPNVSFAAQVNDQVVMQKLEHIYGTEAVVNSDQDANSYDGDSPDPVGNTKG